jgi:hypothetical protein
MHSLGSISAIASEKNIFLYFPHVFFMPIGNPRWPPQTILVFDLLIFYILLSSPLKPFGQINRNLVGSIYGKSSVSFGKAVSEKIFLEINQSETRIVCGGHVC